MNKILYIFLTTFLFCESLEEIVTDCKTPENTNGFCINIHSCQTLLIRNAREFIRRRCGPRNEDKRKPRVCCAANDIKVAENIPKPITCGIQNVTVSARILSGEETVTGEFPWLARLIRKSTEDELVFSCTGSLITSKVVLTAAHCLVAPELEQLGILYAVTLGEHETECGFNNNQCSNHKNLFLVAKTIKHPGFSTDDKNHDNDIGLIVLRKNVKTTRFIVPICLLEENYETSQYFISGWGKTESGTLSSIKLKISLPPYSWQQCVEKYNLIGVRISNKQICAGGLDNQDSCGGDSGGPLMVLKNGKWYVAGVVSFGLGCGREGWPGVYTYLPRYIEWIKNKLP